MIAGPVFRRYGLLHHLRDVAPDRFHRPTLALAIPLYILTAWNSTGFHGADEHYQIIEFAQWKLGELPADALAWEFAAGIRSSLQPWIAATVFKCADAVGLTSPFTKAFLLRLLSAILALVAVGRFVRATGHAWPRRWRSAYILASYLLWFLPLLYTHFSSESWAAIFLLWMLAAVLAKRWQWPVFAGLLAGIAILCRPPTALIVLSCMAWMLWVRRDRSAFLAQMGAATMLMLLLGLWLDRAFYGAFTPTLWNYLHMGFTGEPGRFGVLPWYYYPPLVFKYAIPPIGTVILVSFLALLINHPRHIAVWCILPYLLAHTLIPHKELRFLYPLAGLVPWVMVQAWAGANMHRKADLARKGLAITAVVLVAAVNFLGLAVVALTPAGQSVADLARTTNRTCTTPCTIGFAVEAGEAWRIMPPSFYRAPNANYVVLGTGTNDTLPPDTGLVVAPDDHPLPPLPEGTRWAPVAHAMPAWASALMAAYTWGEGPAPWTLYQPAPAATDR